MKKTPEQIASDNESACGELLAFKKFFRICKENNLMAMKNLPKFEKLVKDRIEKDYKVNIHFIEKIVS